MNVYIVEYEVQNRDKKKISKRWSRPTWNNTDENLCVLANGDARSAIRKAEKYVLATPPFEYDDDEGEPHIEKVVGFRATSAKQIASVDVP